MQRILGIDPGLARTGYGLVHAENGKVILDEGGVIATKADRPLADRIHEIASEVNDLIDEWSPEVMVIEQVFSLGKNPKSAILLAHLRGALLYAARNKDLQVVHYRPTEIKKLLTGHGRAGKEQMQAVIKSELGLSEVPRPHDVADALAIALCHLHSNIHDLGAA